MRRAAGVTARELSSSTEVRWPKPLRTVFIILLSLIASGALIGCSDPETVRRLPAPDRALLESAIAVATPSTVKVKGVACGLATAGSGVVVATHLVLTAAHVVAGATESQVIDSAGAHRAIPVVVDPLSDMAVLYVDDLGGAPLQINDAPATRGAVGVVLGYPHAGDLEVSPAVVLDNYRGEGHDIYGQQRIVRQILEVQARIELGSSGGALVDSRGALIGMVFGQSEDELDIGYALPSAAIKEVVEAGVGLTQGRPNAVPTGACLTSLGEGS